MEERDVPGELYAAMSKETEGGVGPNSDQRSLIMGVEGCPVLSCSDLASSQHIRIFPPPTRLLRALLR